MLLLLLLWCEVRGQATSGHHDEMVVCDMGHDGRAVHDVLGDKMRRKGWI